MYGNSTLRFTHHARLPACAAACSHPLIPQLFSLPASGLHPSRRTSPSTRRSLASTRQPPALHFPPSVLLPVVSAPQSSLPWCACSSTSLFPFPSSEIILALVRNAGSRSDRFVWKSITAGWPGVKRSVATGQAEPSVFSCLGAGRNPWGRFPESKIFRVLGTDLIYSIKSVPYIAYSKIKIQ
jgi:hypothetical protein